MALYDFENTEKLEEKDPDKLSDFFHDQSLHRRFLEERKIFLWGTVNDKSCQDIVKKLFLRLSIILRHRR